MEVTLRISCQKVESSQKHLRKGILSVSVLLAGEDEMPNSALYLEQSANCPVFREPFVVFVLRQGLYVALAGLKVLCGLG